ISEAGTARKSRPGPNVTRASATRSEARTSSSWTRSPRSSRTARSSGRIWGNAAAGMGSSVVGSDEKRNGLGPPAFEGDGYIVNAFTSSYRKRTEEIGNALDCAQHARRVRGGGLRRREEG